MLSQMTICDHPIARVYVPLPVIACAGECVETESINRTRLRLVLPVRASCFALPGPSVDPCRLVPAVVRQHGLGQLPDWLPASPFPGFWPGNWPGYW